MQKMHILEFKYVILELTGRDDMAEKQMEIYRGIEGEIVFNVDKGKETIWATQAQMAELFGVQRAAITKHLSNIFNTGELEKNAVCSILEHTAGDGKKYKTMYYNLDAIISVGYRVNSRKATDFRIWATKVLKNYVVDGVAVNERRLKELDAKKLREVEGALSIVRRLVAANELSASEASGVLEVISKYAPSFRALEEFDEGYISFSKSKKAAKAISAAECEKIIAELKKNLKANELFGKPRGKAFCGTLNAIFQTFETEDLYPSVAEKAANLLYLVIKDHPFYDGNKRIGALLFVVFLSMNNFHLTKNGETKISDRALTALALLIAESNPKEKQLLVALVCKLLEN